MSGTLAVELGHEGAVGVSDEQHGRVEHLNLFLAALVRLHADAAAAPPVVLLPLEAFNQRTSGRSVTGRQRFNDASEDVPPTSVVERAVEVEAASVVTGHELDQVPYPGVACTREAGQSHQGAGPLRQKHSLFAPGVYNTRGEKSECRKASETLETFGSETRRWVVYDVIYTNAEQLSSCLKRNQ